MKSISDTIQMKATEHYFPVVLYITLYKVVLTIKSIDEILKCNLTIQMKVTEPSLLVVLFIMVPVSGSLNF